MCLVLYRNPSQSPSPSMNPLSITLTRHSLCGTMLSFATCGKARNPHNTSCDASTGRVDVVACDDRRTPVAAITRFAQNPARQREEGLVQNPARQREEDLFKIQQDRERRKDLFKIQQDRERRRCSKSSKRERGRTCSKSSKKGITGCGG